MIAASGVFLLRDLIYHAVFGIVSHFLSRPSAFGRIFQVFFIYSAEAHKRATPLTPDMQGRDRAPHLRAPCVERSGQSERI